MRPQLIAKIALYVMLTGIMALPLFGLRLPKLLPSMWLLVIHEFAAFIYFGHTVFSNIWSMRLRQTQPVEAGVWARGLSRKLAMRVTFTTTLIIPLAGLMLIEDWGGLANAPWAWDAYLCFWLVAAISVFPDVIRLAWDAHADEPKHGMFGGGARGMIALFLTFYVMWCMMTKQAWISG